VLFRSRGTEFGARADSKEPPPWTPPERDVVIMVPHSNLPAKPLVALPAVATEEESWKASVMGMADPDANRYFRVNRLINDALKCHPRPTYFILPELALPRRWFNRLAHRMNHSGVSLIAGLEYQHHGQSSGIPGAPDSPYVSNQVRAALVSDVLGYTSLVIYEQEKQRAAPEEADLLRQTAGKELRPMQEPVVRKVVQHGHFHFGILICSELTNIENRAKFRGMVDALIVPEWNQDINSFSSLVEAAALDVHCFMIQVNNRRYGDCRIPYKAEFRRDIARIKGGVTDYYVLARLDVPELREFQTLNLSPDNPTFKPKPDGYLINPRRRRLRS